MDNKETVFLALHDLLSAYQPPLMPKRDEPGYYDLWSFKPLEIEGRKRSEVFFAGAIIQKSYVGFYFMPVYVDVEVKTLFAPELLRLLKGKSCFHIKKWDESLRTQVQAALKAGFDLYLKRGWV
jgi:hypothetical protein